MAMAPVVIIVFAAIVGISSALLSEKEDVSAQAEVHIAEGNTFYFDSAPDSKELGPIAMEKIRSASRNQRCSECCSDKEMEE